MDQNCCQCMLSHAASNFNENKYESLLFSLKSHRRIQGSRSAMYMHGGFHALMQLRPRLRDNADKRMQNKTYLGPSPLLLGITILLSFAPAAFSSIQSDHACSHSSLMQWQSLPASVRGVTAPLSPAHIPQSVAELSALHCHKTVRPPASHSGRL